MRGFGDLEAVIMDRVWSHAAPVTVRDLFDEIQRAGGVDPEEMARVFNLGLGMVIAVPPAAVGPGLAALAGAGQEAMVVGRLVPGCRQVQFG